MNCKADLIRFYALLKRLERKLGGTRRLAGSSGRMPWPKRGVYFFFEAGERRAETSAGLRVVRVGTHALTPRSSTTLWNRLSQHRGTLKGGGNHRGSIFRLIVGTALDPRPDSWGRGNSAPHEIRASEQAHERRVSAVIGTMPFLWLTVEDEPGPDSLRGLIERNAIALLSNYGRPPLNPPSPGWLGRRCDRERVRASGLWNQNHVDNVYDPAFLNLMEQLIDEHAR